MGRSRKKISLRWFNDTCLHIETPHSIINIRPDLCSFEGYSVDSIEIIKDSEAEFPDSPGSKAMNVRVWTKGGEYNG